MKKFLTDMHTHSAYSHDGQNELKDMLAAAHAKGLGFYGVSDHFNYDYDITKMSAEELAEVTDADPEDYFHGARHLQEDYEGCMNVLVGAEFGFSDDEAVKQRYAETYQKYRPDYVINSVHGTDGKDFYRYTFTESKKKIYQMYLGLIRRSLDAPYPYDIVGHIGYISRYVPFPDAKITVEECGEQIDDILTTIIQKDKILEVNTATKTLPQSTLPGEDILCRYYQLGGQKISFGSDAHCIERIAEKREETMALLKKIGFTHLTIPFKGEHIKVEI